MILRFTLSHTSGTQTISEPEGWRDIKMILERDPEYWGLIEQFEVPLLFYGDNGEHDGGKDFIETVEETYGVGAVITLLIQTAPTESDDYELVFEGTLDLSTLNEVDDLQIEVAVLAKNFWAKFKNRFDTPVDLRGITDLDGNAVTPTDYINIRMTGQVIQYYGEYRWKEGFGYPDNDGYGLDLQFDWDQIVKDDIKKFTVPRARTTGYTLNSLVYTNAAPQFEAPWDGDYYFDVKMTYASYFDAGGPDYSGNDANIIIGRAGEPLAFGQSFTHTTVTVGSYSYSVDTFQGTLTLKKGEQVIIVGDANERVEVFGEERLVWLADVDVATTTSITLSGEQNIDGVLTSSSRVLVKDQGDPAENGVYVSNAGAWTRATDNDSAAEMTNVIVYVTGGNANIDSAWKQVETINVLGVDLPDWTYTTWSSYERFLAFPGTTVENYVKITASTVFPETTVEGFLVENALEGVFDRITDGATIDTGDFAAGECEGNHAIIQGLQQRGLSLEDKPFHPSFKKLWDGLNPIFNLGIGHEVVGGLDVVTIKPKRDFFDSTSNSINLSWVNNIRRSYDKNMIFKKISIGYDKWQSEDISGLDDPQTKKTYATVFETVGKEETLYSKFIASSLALEVTRRKSVELLSDYKFDNDTFIVALNPTPVDDSPDYYLPELDENFASTTNLLNPDTRYNLFLTPLRNFFRWADFFNGCLQKNLTSVYKFVSGEGNYTFSSDYDCTSGIKKDCPGTVCDDIAENDDISLATYGPGLGYMFTPLMYEFTHPLTWEEYKAIRDNRNKSIGVSTTDSGHEVCFIKRLEYDINMSNAKFLVWKK